MTLKAQPKLGQQAFLGTPVSSRAACGARTRTNAVRTVAVLETPAKMSQIIKWDQGKRIQV